MVNMAGYTPKFKPTRVTMPVGRNGKGQLWKRDIIVYIPIEGPPPEYLALIQSAFLLLEALKNIENDDGRIPKAIWDMRNEAITKATVKP